MRWNQLSNDLPKAMALSDLLCGAAMADGEFAESERVVVRAMLLKVLGAGELPAEVEAHLAAFSADRLDVAAAVATLGAESERDRKSVLRVTADVVKSDQSLDTAERQYLMKVADALGLDFVDAF
jgi:uncharacterized tellurite resistance protein B-like protein